MHPKKSKQRVGLKFYTPKSTGNLFPSGDTNASTDGHLVAVGPVGHVKRCLLVSCCVFLCCFWTWFLLEVLLYLVFAAFVLALVLC